MLVLVLVNVLDGILERAEQATPVDIEFFVVERHQERSFLSVHEYAHVHVHGQPRYCRCPLTFRLN